MLFGLNFYRLYFTGVVVGIDNRVFLEFPWPFNYPVGRIFMVKTALVTDEFFHFMVFVLTGSNPLYFVTKHPKCGFTAAFITIPVGIVRFVEPYPLFESKSLISKRSYRANINHVSGELIINSFRDTGRDLRMVAPVHHTVNTVIGKLVGSHYTTVAKDATVHVQLYLVANVFGLKSPFILNKARFGSTMLKAKVLQVALTGLVAHRAIQRVVDQKEFGYRFTGIHYPFRRNAFYFHTIHTARNARSHKFRHRPWIGLASFRYFYKAATAFTPASF
jgi:hypothetical protein